MFIFDFLNAAAKISCGITNQLVKPICFVSIYLMLIRVKSML